MVSLGRDLRGFLADLDFLLLGAPLFSTFDPGRSSPQPKVGLFPPHFLFAGRFVQPHEHRHFSAGAGSACEATSLPDSSRASVVGAAAACCADTRRFSCFSAREASLPTAASAFTALCGGMRPQSSTMHSSCGLSSGSPVFCERRALRWIE